MTKKIIQEFIFFKKSIGELKSQEEFGLKIGYRSKSSFSQALSKNPIPEELVMKINSVYPEFLNWQSRSNVKRDIIQNFGDLPIGDQMMMLNKKMEYLIKSEDLNRIYIKTIMAKLDIRIDVFKDRELELEKIKKTVSN